MRPRQRRARSGQRGAAALEFALSLIFLIPLLLGTLDYGYYFWVGVNAVEAAKEGVAAAARAGNGVPNCGSPLAAAPTVAGSARATAYLINSVGAAMAANATVTVTCVAAPVNPSWRIVVQMDFPPAVGFVRVGMPTSAIAGRVRFRTQPLVRR
jgi:Flp pilus assembly protein TadG